jgi:hypothetical protein
MEQREAKGKSKRLAENEIRESRSEDREKIPGLVPGHASCQFSETCASLLRTEDLANQLPFWRSALALHANGGEIAPAGEQMLKLWVFWFEASSDESLRGEFEPEKTETKEKGDERILGVP